MTAGPRSTLAQLVAGAILALAVAPAAAFAQTPTSSLATSTLGAPPTAGLPGLAIGDTMSLTLVEGATGQVLVARGEQVRRPVASAIKLVTALVVSAELPVGTPVTVGDEVIGIEGSSYGLRPGEVRSVDDLLAGLLLRSGNDAAVALAVATAGSEDAFVERMAVLLEELGIDARPGSASGLDERDALSAIELAVVARAALAEPRIRRIVGSPLLVVDGVEVENRNQFLRDAPDATGIKTGFTSAAGFTLAASARRDGRELVAVVLGAADDRERRRVAGELLEHGFTATVPVTLDRSLALRTTSGPVLFALVDATITVRDASDIAVSWPRTLRPDDALAAVAVSVDGVTAGTASVTRRDGRRDVASPSLGRALADGAYAALRPVGLGMSDGSAGGAASGLR